MLSSTSTRANKKHWSALLMCWINRPIFPTWPTKFGIGYALLWIDSTVTLFSSDSKDGGSAR